MGIVHKKVCSFIFLSIFITHSADAIAEFPPFETAWLESTGGAGVGSILMDESTVLNPAPLAFFNNASVYFQKSGVDTTTGDNASYKMENSKQLAFIASDATGFGGGSFSYIKTEHSNHVRKRFSFAMGYPTGKTSAIGINHSLNKEEFGPQENKYYQTTLGIAHAIDPTFTLGLIVIDPFKKREEESRAFLGFQYTYKGFVTILLDAGANYTTEFSKSFTYKSAMQIKILSDFSCEWELFEIRVLTSEAMVLAWDGYSQNLF